MMSPWKRALRSCLMIGFLLVAAAGCTATSAPPVEEPVEEVEELPDQEDRDSDRRGHDDSGQEIGPQTAEQARGLEWLDHPELGARPLGLLPVLLLVPPTW